MKIKISTYTEGQQLPAHCFFILNKGLNSGKPGDHPWANCFVAHFETLEERDHYYWLCYGIWITGKFHCYLIGSVIPFIRKDDLLEVLDLADTAIHDRQELYLQSISLLYEAQQHSQKIITRLGELQRAKLDILRHFIRI